MRTYEIALSSITLCVALYSIFNGRKKDNKNYRALILLLPIMAAHIFIEGIRWQMYGVYAYLIYLVLRLMILPKKRLSIGESGQNKGIAVLSVVAVVLSIFLSLLFKMNELPQLTGNYEVGTISLDLVDDNRPELYSDTPGNPRKIRVQFWYPIDEHTDKKLVPWMADGKLIAEAVPEEAGLPGFLMDSAALIYSNSYGNANVSKVEETYPLVIISHGWTGFRNLHTDVAELLASNGYIAVSIDHTYGSLVTMFDNGDIAMLDRNALPSREETSDFLTYADKLVTTYAYDDRLVLDYLGRLTTDSLFYHRIDFDHIGAFGHSTGGGGAVKLSLEDPRIKAVFGLDPWVEPVGHEELSKGMQIPSLFIRSEMWQEGYNNAYLKTLVEHSTIKPMTYQMNGSNHLDFTMLYMYQPLYKYIGYSGKLDANENASIQREFILHFFDTTLKGINNSLDSLVDQYEPIVKINY